MKVTKIFFSPTGKTKQVIDELAAAWDRQADEIDLSDTQIDFTKYKLTSEDLCLIAVPSFGGRVPEIAAARLSDIKGNHARTILIAAYGNRAYEDTLLELKDLAKSCGFDCVAAVAAVTEHSILHQFGAGRPDASDRTELLEFAQTIKNALLQNPAKEPTVPGNFPYREYGGVPFKPVANKKCTSCKTCASVCPSGAIPLQSPNTTDRETCISCMRCVSVCPTHARDLPAVMLFMAAQKMKKACTSRKENSLFL